MTQHRLLAIVAAAALPLIALPLVARSTPVECLETVDDPFMVESGVVTDFGPIGLDPSAKNCFLPYPTPVVRPVFEARTITPFATHVWAVVPVQWSPEVPDGLIGVRLGTWYAFCLGEDVPLTFHLDEHRQAWVSQPVALRNPWTCGGSITAIVNDVEIHYEFESCTYPGVDSFCPQ